VGYSPYYTTAVWFGFDRPGNSLGLTLTGSTLAGPLWADYMREIHLGLPFRDFVRPNTGLIDVTVCTRSGLLRTSFCTHGETTLPFMLGTQPVLLCDYHGNDRGREIAIRHIELDSMFIDTSDVVRNLSMPVIRDEALRREFQSAEQRRLQGGQTSRQTPSAPRTTTTSRTSPAAGRILSNPLLDDLPPAPVSLPGNLPVLNDVDTLIPEPSLDETQLQVPASLLDPPSDSIASAIPAVIPDSGPPVSEVSEEEAGEASLEVEFAPEEPPLFNPLID
jgi:penicillin-binding protein 1A